MSQTSCLTESGAPSETPPAAAPAPPAQTSLSADPDTLRQVASQIAATCAGYKLRRASRAVTQHFDHALAPVNLRTTQFTLLSALALAAPASIGRLASALVMDRTTLTRNVRLLRSTGLVEVRPGRAGREQQLALTPAGRETLARAIPLWRTAQGQVVGAFGPELWPTMVAELDRLVAGMQGGPHPHEPPEHVIEP